MLASARHKYANHMLMLTSFIHFHLFRWKSFLLSTSDDDMLLHGQQFQSLND